MDRRCLADRWNLKVFSVSEFLRVCFPVAKYSMVQLFKSFFVNSIVLIYLAVECLVIGPFVLQHVWLESVCLGQRTSNIEG